MSDDYEQRSLSEGYQHFAQVAKQPLADRKEAAKAFGTALRDSALIAERCSWLIAGNYGYGEMLYAKQGLSRKRSNRPATLVQLIAAYEWMCPADMAIKEWKKLSAAEKAALQKAVEKVIASYDRGEE